MPAGKSRYMVVIKRGPQQGRGFPLEAALVSLGRYAGNTIILSDETVSRHHARLRRTEDGYSAEDLNSANGLFVNGERVTTPRPLKSGDVIRLGEVVELLFESVSEREAAAELSAATPALDERPGPTRQISDIVGTVWMQKVEAPAGREAPKTGGGRVWMWVAIAAGVVVVAAIIYFAAFAGR